MSEDKKPLEDSEKSELVDDKEDQQNKGKFSIGSFSFVECQLLFLLCLAIIVIIILTAILLVMNQQNSIMCSSPECVRQGATIIEVMNTSASPCNDFYNYACGNWERVHVAQPGVGKYSGFYRATRRNMERLFQILQTAHPDKLLIKGRSSVAARQAHTYFQACVNTSARTENSVAAASKLITMLGGWTLTKLTKLRPKGDDSSVIKKIAIANSMLSYPFLQVSPSYNRFNKKQLAISIGHGFAPYQRSALVTNSPKHRKAYVDFGVAVARTIGEINEPSVKKRMEELWALESKLETWRSSYVSRRSYGSILKHKNSYLFTVKRLVAVITERLGSLAGDPDNVLDDVMKTYAKQFLGITIPTSHYLIWVDSIEYLLKLSELFAKEMSKRQHLLTDYVVMTVLRSFSHSLGDGFQEARRIEKQVIYGNNVLENTWYYCTVKTDVAFKFATGALAIQKYIPPSSIKAVSTMVENLCTSLEESIKKSTWMDTATKNHALKKVKNIKKTVVHPPWLFDVAKLDALYNDYTVVKNNFFESYLNIRKTKRQRSLKVLHHEHNSHIDWFHSPLTANAFYGQIGVKMTILGGVLQLPFFDEHFQLPFQYGALGSVIGHELSHAFDARGRYFDEHGNLKVWWTDKTLKQYESRKQCFVKQYSSYTFFGVHNNGAHTVEENMADNGGVSISFQAMKSIVSSGSAASVIPGLKLTPEKVFFLAFSQLWCGHYNKNFGKKLTETDVHSPYPHRVLGTLSNHPEFAQAFNCPINSKYNPKTKCTLW